MNWLRRQRSDQMDQDEDSKYNVLATAIAAAAFAIHSLEEDEANGTKKGNKRDSGRLKLAHPNESTRRLWLKKTKSSGDTVKRLPSGQIREGLLRAFSSSRTLKEPEDSMEKTGRNDSLKVVLGWANAKMKGKHQNGNKQV